MKTKMTETTDKPVRQKKKGEIPVYVTIATVLAVCLIYSGLANEDLWDSLSDSPGYFLGLLGASLVILLPISAVVGFITWFIVQKVNNTKFAFSPFWIGSLVVAAGCLYGGKIYMQNAENLEKERIIAASQVSISSLKNIELFDGSMRRSNSYGSSETYTINRVVGRIRNNLNRPLASVEIRVIIRNGDNEIIETFDFTRSLSIYASGADALLPGHARGFSYQKRIERIPKDYKVQWGIIGARYSID